MDHDKAPKHSQTAALLCAGLAALSNRLKCLFSSRLNINALIGTSDEQSAGNNMALITLQSTSSSSKRKDKNKCCRVLKDEIEQLLL